MNDLSGEVMYSESSSTEREEPLRKRFWVLEVAKEKEMRNMRMIRRMEGNFEDVGLRFPMSFLWFCLAMYLWLVKKMLDLNPLVQV